MSLPGEAKTVQEARLCIIFVAIGYSIMGVAFKFIPWNPMAISGIRSALAAIMLIILTGQRKIRITKENLIGAFFSFMTSVCFVVANKLTSAVNAIVLQYTNPLFTVLYCILIKRMKVKRKDIVLMTVAFSGMILFFLDGISGGNWAGNCIALVSGICMAGTTLYAFYSGAKITEYLLLCHIMTFLCGIPFLLLDPPVFSVASSLSVMIMALFSVALPEIFFQRGVRMISPVETSVYLMLDPVLNPLWVALIVHEYPSAFSLAGAVLVIASVLYWNLADKMNLVHQSKK